MKPSKTISAFPSRRWRRRLTMCSAACLPGLLLASGAAAQDLSSYAILAGSEIENTGSSVITGNIGLSPGTSFAGQSSMTINGEVNIANAVAVQAKSDLTTAYNVLRGLPATNVIVTGQLGGQFLQAGVHSLASSALLDGTLTLQGDEDDIFVIQIGSALTVGSDAVVFLDGTVQAKNVFFVVGSSATLGTNADFAGQILAQASITLLTDATIDCGAAWAQTGKVTLDDNDIDVCTFTTEAGEIEDILGDDITDNGGSIVDAIAEFVENDGVLPLSFQLLALLSPTELEEALEQLSGELGTEVAPAGMQGVDSFLDLLRGSHGDSGRLLAGLDQPQSGGTISVMGYAAETPQAGGAAFTNFDAPSRAHGEWTTWISSYGGQSRVEGDADAGSHDRTITDFGVAIGFERQLDGGGVVGVAVSGGGTAFELSDGLGNGDTAMLQAAIYARASFADAYLAGALAAGVHQVSLDRYLTFAGEDHFTADFTAGSVAADLEAGYRMGWFTPYVALRGQIFANPGYAEETASGSSIFALDYEGGLSTSLRSEVGARAEWTADLGEDQTLTLYASGAWAHTIRSGDSMEASFQALADSTFTVNGATSAADSLLASAGLDLALGNGFVLSGSVDGAFAENALRYGATGGLSYSW